MVNLTPVVIYLLLGAVIAAVLMVMIGRYRPRPITTPFMLLMLGVVIWTLGSASEIAATNYDVKVFFSHVKYIGITIIPITWLGVAIEYTTNDVWFARRKNLAFAIMPVITILLAFTSTYHDWFRHRFELIELSGYSVLLIDSGPLFWVHTCYSYGLLLLGTAVLFRAFWRSPQLYRGQILLMIFAAVAPWVANIGYVWGYEPIVGVDLTPLTFIVTGLATAWSITHYNLVDIVPVARTTVMEQMKDAVIVLDQDDRIVDINPIAMAMLGVSESHGIGQPLINLIAEKDSLKAFLLDARAERMVIECEGDEQLCYFDAQVTPLKSRVGTNQGRIAVFRDSTQQKQAENELRALIAAMNDSILILDDDGCFLRAEVTDATSITVPVNELVGQMLDDVFPEEQAQSFLATIHESLAASKTMQIEYGLPGHDAMRWFHVSISPLHHNTVIWVARDITSRKSAELKLNAFSDELQEQVKKRTAQLEQEIAVRQDAEENLKRSLAEKEVLLKEIHHRVKNNMQVVSSLLSLQASQVDDDAVEALFHDSQNRIHSMALIHEQLYQSHDLALIDFGSYINVLLNHLILSYRSAGITLQSEVNDIYLDIDSAIPCGLIVNELVSNALKHAFPNGQGGTVTVTMHEGDAGQLVLIVQDDGVGFPEDGDLQPADTLGLKLVNSLTHQLMGTIEKNGEKGTTFVIHFTAPELGTGYL